MWLYRNSDAKSPVADLLGPISNTENEPAAVFNGPIEDSKDQDAAEALIILSNSVALDFTQQDRPESSIKNIEISSEALRLKEENEALQLKISSLNYRVHKYMTKSLPSVIQDDENTTFYTGLPNYATYKAVLDYFTPKAQKLQYWRGSGTRLRDGLSNSFNDRCLDVPTEFLMVMMRLRLGFPNKELSRIFAVSESVVSFTFTTWINFMFQELKLLFPLPDRLSIKKCLPKAFAAFPNVVLIIDCTELRVQRPGSLQMQKEVFSNYKHYTTYKVLLGITPAGLLCYISPFYGGGVTDRNIVIDSGFLNLLKPGDEIMVDKGFQIDDILPEGVTSNMPPIFHKKKDHQMPVEDVNKTKKIASVRVHVERAIRRIKAFHIFDGPLKSNMSHLAEQIFGVCAFITNFQKTLIKEKV